MQILNKPASKNDKETEALESPTLGPSPQKSKPSEEPEKVDKPPVTQKEEQKPQDELPVKEIKPAVDVVEKPKAFTSFANYSMPLKQQRMPVDS